MAATLPREDPEKSEASPPQPTSTQSRSSADGHSVDAATDAEKGQDSLTRVETEVVYPSAKKTAVILTATGLATFLVALVCNCFMLLPFQ